MSELIFVRHGETESNSNGLLHGRTDIPLAPSGIQQAARVAGRISSLGQVKLIYSSPLKRAYQTAREIGRLTGLEPIVDDRLSEFDFGDLEGLTFDDLQSQHPDLYLSMIDPNGFDRSFPNGESRSHLHDRVVEAIDQICSRDLQGRTVIVAHLVVIATAVAHLTTGDPHDVIRYLVRNCSITQLQLNGQGPADVRLLDDIAHLET